jgi:hypothetical protein
MTRQEAAGEKGGRVFRLYLEPPARQHSSLSLFFQFNISVIHSKSQSQLISEEDLLTVSQLTTQNACINIFKLKIKVAFPVHSSHSHYALILRIRPNSIILLKASNKSLSSSSCPHSGSRVSHFTLVLSTSVLSRKLHRCDTSESGECFTKNP